MKLFQKIVLGLCLVISFFPVISFAETKYTQFGGFTIQSTDGGKTYKTETGQDVTAVYNKYNDLKSQYPDFGARGSGEFKASNGDTLSVIKQADGSLAVKTTFANNGLAASETYTANSDGSLRTTITKADGTTAVYGTGKFVEDPNNPTGPLIYSGASGNGQTDRLGIYDADGTLSTRYDQTTGQLKTTATDDTPNICDTNGVCKYKMLAPISGILGNSSGYYEITRDTKSLCTLLNSWFRIGIGLAGLLAVVMIVWGGFQYATTDALETAKTEGKSKISNALWGLLLALTTYLILNTINPDLTNCELKAGVVNLQAVALSTALDTTGLGGAIGLGVYGASLATDAASRSGVGGGSDSSGASNSKWKSDWNDYTVQQIEASGLLDLSPADSAKYFPNGNPTAQDWANLIAKVVDKESGYNPNNVYYETTMGKNSVGLLQLSADDSVVRKLGYSEQDLKDPYNNITAGVQILKNTIEKGGVISGQTNSGKWIGATSYWSTLRNGLGQVK